MSDVFKLITAAVSARDVLRLKVAPQLDKLASEATDPAARDLIVTLRTQVIQAVDDLRVALKDR